VEQTDLIAALRQEIGDKEQPYKYDDSALLVYIKSAVSDYSLYRPRRKRGTIYLREDLLEYPLPAGYQTWVMGLENYDVIDDTLYLDAYPKKPFDLTFVYLGDHDIASLPDNAQSIIIDYCMWKLLSDAVREGSEISELKLGKGLDIRFNNFDQIRELAQQRYDSYLAAVRNPIGGGT
jgi:hypothetical protein